MPRVKKGSVVQSYLSLHVAGRKGGEYWRGTAMRRDEK